MAPPDPETEPLPRYEPPSAVSTALETASETTEVAPPDYEPPAATSASTSPVSPETDKGKALAPASYRVQTSMLLDAESLDKNAKATSSATASDYRVHTSMLLDAGPAIPHTFVADRAEILPPTVLVLAGQVIYAENAPDVTLYEADLGLTSLVPATKHVELQRLDYRTLADGSTRVRARSFYALAHIHRIFKTDLPGWYIYNRSSRTAPLGDFGWKDVSTDSWEALPMNIEKLELAYLEGGKPLFRARHKNGVCTWTDKAQNEVALMFETAEAGATTTPRLVVTAPMRRDRRDVLVALWCCYVWEQAVNRYVPVPVPRGKNPNKLSRLFN